MTEKWIGWGRRLAALAQNGLAYGQNPFDIERYQALRGIAAEILAEGSTLPAGQVESFLSLEAGYATPKIDVRGAAFRDHNILLVRETLDGGRWTLPGGWMDVGDTPGGAAAREFREETGYEVRPARLAAVYDRDTHGHPPMGFAVIKLFFICEIVGGSPAASSETGESAYFTEAALPELSLSRVNPGEIAMLFRHHRQPDLPTEFDGSW